jgi:hypothetical protein
MDGSAVVPIGVREPGDTIPTREQLRAERERMTMHVVEQAEILERAWLIK